jgi:hypothetical protein
MVPKVESDAFGEIVFASLVVQCGQLKMLPSMKRNHRGEITELFDGHETVHVHFDTLETEETPPVNIFLLNILSFDCLGSYGLPYPAGLTGLLLAPSELNIGFYERIGRFWIDKHPSPRMGRADENEDLEDGSQLGFNEEHREPRKVRELHTKGDLDQGRGDVAKTVDVDIKAGYRSSIWASLQHATMHQKLAQAEASEEAYEDYEEQFIITLI